MVGLIVICARSVVKGLLAVIQIVGI